MPIVDVEIVTDTQPDSALAGQLADTIGRALGSDVGRTWVRLRTLPRDFYGESGGEVPGDITPVFVTIAARRHPEPSDIEQAATAVCQAVATTLGAPPENVHVLFGPDARGAVAFGGTIVRD